MIVEIVLWVFILVLTLATCSLIESMINHGKR